MGLPSRCLAIALDVIDGLDFTDGLTESPNEPFADHFGLYRRTQYHHPPREFGLYRLSPGL